VKLPDQLIPVIAAAHIIRSLVADDVDERAGITAQSRKPDPFVMFLDNRDVSQATITPIFLSATSRLRMSQASRSRPPRRSSPYRDADSTSS
jgi:hypothetical protein